MSMKRGGGTTDQGLTWVKDFLIIILFLFAGLFYLALIFKDPVTREAALDLGAKVLGPSIPAAVAFYGVLKTLENTRKQDLLKEWHSNLRWATDLCVSKEPEVVAIGVAAIDALDDAPFLGNNENDLVDSLIKQITRSWDSESR
ncbi:MULTISPECIES: hypothetical protein [Corynebacterium]|uniref:hypothetical protein n=1 Tax=Corynebacterium TaxID=1716 RepID=UPI0008D922AD|nr:MULTISPECIES: hypothetical protein [Corynebacterium]MCQ4606951.1 hypothetical protein [Corynebacterium pseudogenitalium]MDK8363654.1 hypothetical protein [Corynebacterium sp. UMB10119B]